MTNMHHSYIQDWNDMRWKRGHAILLADHTDIKCTDGLLLIEMIECRPNVQNHHIVGKVLKPETIDHPEIKIDTTTNRMVWPGTLRYQRVFAFDYSKLSENEKLEVTLQLPKGEASYRISKNPRSGAQLLLVRTSYLPNRRLPEKVFGAFLKESLESKQVFLELMREEAKAENAVGYYGCVGQDGSG